MNHIILLLLLALFTATAHAQVTTLQIVNARAGELTPIPGGTEQDKITFQGNAVDGWQAKIAAIRIDEITQWTVRPPRYGFAATRVAALAPLQADGSVKIALKCPMTYQLRGVDAAGNVVAEDNSLHYAVCGESVTCHGCHDAHSVERAALYNPAVERFAKTIAAGKPPTPGC